MLGFAGVRVLLLMDASSVLNGRAVFVPKHALALAHASGGGKCKRRVPYPECNGGRRRRSAQARARKIRVPLVRARGRASQQVWLPCFARRAWMLSLSGRTGFGWRGNKICLNHQ